MTSEPIAKPPRLIARPDDHADNGEDLEVVDGWIELDGVGLEGRTITAPDVEVIEFTNCSLRSCRFVLSPHTEVKARQTSFANCDLSQVYFTTVRGSRLSSCKMTGTQIVGELSDTEIVDSQLKTAALAMSTIGRVSFAGCELDDVDMQESKLTDVTFDGSRLTEVGMHRTMFERVDLREATIGSLTSVETLHGCVVANHQLYELAPLLASIIGLQVD